MPLPSRDKQALHLAFRLALLDEVLAEKDREMRHAALVSARDRLSCYLLQDKEAKDLSSTVRGVEERAALAAALQSAFEEVRSIIGDIP